MHPVRTFSVDDLVALSDVVRGIALAPAVQASLTPFVLHKVFEPRTA